MVKSYFSLKSKCMFALSTSINYVYNVPWQKMYRDVVFLSVKLRQKKNTRVTSGKRNTWLELERKDNRGEGSKRSEMKRERIIDYTKKKDEKDCQTIYRDIGHWKKENEKENIYTFERHFASLHDPIREH